MIVRVCLERGTDICTPKHVTSGAISALSITLQLRGTFDLFLLVNLTNRRMTKLSGHTCPSMAKLTCNPSR